MKSAKVSIIVPFYNCENYIDKCIESLLAQTYENIEIICIDDQSPDRCGEILDRYAAEDSRITVIHQENMGLSGARNSGMKKATGEYVMFVDGDDWLESATIEEMLKTITETNADSVMCCYRKEFADHSAESHIFDSDRFFEGEDFEENIYKPLFGLRGEALSCPQNTDLLVSACMQLFKRELCADIEFIDTKKIGTEDLLYQIEVYKSARSFAYIDKAFYHYRKDNETSLTTLYKPELYSRWQTLYDILEEKIEAWDLGADYKKALSARIAFSMIGIGLNETKAPKNIFRKASFLKKILKTPRYKAAMKMLPMKYFPIHWKVFFRLAKWRMTFMLMLMLGVIEFLRKRV